MTLRKVYTRIRYVRSSIRNQIVPVHRYISFMKDSYFILIEAHILKTAPWYERFIFHI